MASWLDLLGLFFVRRLPSPHEVEPGKFIFGSFFRPPEVFPSSIHKPSFKRLFLLGIPRFFAKPFFVFGKFFVKALEPDRLEHLVKGHIQEFVGFIGFFHGNLCFIK